MTTDLLIYLLKSSGVLILFFLAFVLLLERETLFKGNRIFLLTGALVSFLWPLFEFVRYNEVVAVPNEALSPGFTNVATPINEPGSFSLSPEEILVLFYILGVLINFIHALFQILRLYLVYKNEKRFANYGMV